MLKLDTVKAEEKEKKEKAQSDFKSSSLHISVHTVVDNSLHRLT